MTMDDDIRGRLLAASRPPGELLSEPGAGARIRQRGLRLRRRRRVLTGSGVAAVVLLIAGAVLSGVLLTTGSHGTPAAPPEPTPSVAPFSPQPTGTATGTPTGGPTNAPTSAPATTPEAATTSGPAGALTPTTIPVVPPAQPGTGSASPSASPSAAAVIMVYGDCTEPSVKPAEIVMACGDYGLLFQGLQWTSWTSTQATATGTMTYKDCIPNCAEGTIIDVPNTHITLTTPVRSPSGQTVWSELQSSSLPPGYPPGPQGVPTTRI